MNLPARARSLAVLIVFSAVFIALTVNSYLRESGTSDEAQQLTAGYAALTLHDYHIDVEHPPIIRMWAALPLLFKRGITLDTNTSLWRDRHFPEIAHELVYRRSDTDSLLACGRFMIVLLGVFLGWLVFFWAREMFGFWPAVIVLGLYATEPNVLAHSGLITTDLGVTLLFFGTIYFLWRTSRKLSLGNVAGLIACCSLAQVAKFSAILLAPVVVILLAIRAGRGDPWVSDIGRTREYPGRSLKLFGIAALLLLLLAEGSLFTIWASMSFRYLPAPEQVDRTSEILTKPTVIKAVPRLSVAINWIDQHHLLPNAYTQGFLLGQSLAQDRPAFLMGRFSHGGWWYYFPLAFLFKTSITVLALFGIALVWCVVDRNTLLQNEAWYLVPIAVYLGAAMRTHINIGLRHILPIYPFVLLACGKPIAALQSRISPRWLLLLLVPPALELACVYPHCLAFFNQACGGPRHGHMLLSDSNIDWGQDLKGLKQWMDKAHVQHINLAFWGPADPEYYHISATYLLGSSVFVKDRVKDLQVPGYVAVSVNQFREPGNTKVRDMYSPLLQREPVAVIGYSIYVYWVDKKWW
ncbi:MAG TPA: glycosyltransferase family 39 protein [Verrucomicrobiae bacterium]|nr:glycosyltransferase family 39 protein [Verrucomicrobiae bacterium]